MPRKNHKNKKYSKELKLQAVQDYISGQGSLKEICRKYEILSDKQLQNWIKWYNGGMETKRKNTAKGEIYVYINGRINKQSDMRFATII